jgi:Glutaredoxin and related proteins
VTEPRVTLITRPGCHLCEVAKEALDRIGEPWTELDVESSRELEADYGDRVPVLLLDGREHGYWRVDEQRLRRDLAR